MLSASFVAARAPDPRPRGPTEAIRGQAMLSASFVAARAPDPRPRGPTETVRG
jgi:hypothetical protein